jgi:hypothetical protein
MGLHLSTLKTLMPDRLESATSMIGKGQSLIPSDETALSP